MKYSIQVLQAEVKRFENAINANNKVIKECKNDKEETKHFKEIIKYYEKQITELKADIKKL